MNNENQEMTQADRINYIRAVEAYYNDTRSYVLEAFNAESLENWIQYVNADEETAQMRERENSTFDATIKKEIAKNA